MNGEFKIVRTDETKKPKSLWFVSHVTEKRNRLEQDIQVIFMKSLHEYNLNAMWHKNLTRMVYGTDSSHLHEQS